MALAKQMRAPGRHLSFSFPEKNHNIKIYVKSFFGPDWCSSVGWASSCKLKSCWFIMPGLQARSPVGGMGEAIDGSMDQGFSCTQIFLTLSFSLPLLLKINKKYFKKYFIYLLLQTGERKEKEREKNINVWLPLTHPLLGTWPSTQACALTENRTCNPLVYSLCSIH